jgi:capsular polysaccharide export protein
MAFSTSGDMKLAYYPGPVSKIPMWRGLAATAGVEARLGGYMFRVPFASSADRAAAEARVAAQIVGGTALADEEREHRVRRLAPLYHRARLICEGAVRHGVTHVGMWNGQGGRRRTLMQVVRQLGFRTLYAELAPIPGHITLDPQGVNAAGMLRRDADYYRAWARAYAGTGGLESWRNGLVARAGVKRESQGDTDSGPFLFVPLQVRGDTQIVLHGGWIKSVPQLIEEVARAAEQLPAGWRVVFREHPSDREGNAEQLGRLVGPRVAVDNVTDTFELVRRSAGVVTVNSSVGLQALLFGQPVLALGHANYAVPGIVATAEGADELGEAFATARDWSIDLALAEAFLRFVAEEYYVPWPITNEAARTRVAAQVRSRLAGRLTDWAG